MSRVDHKTRQHTKMPFGKYKGHWIKDVPVDYLRWAVLNFKDQAMASYFAEELVYRQPSLAKQPKK